MILLWGKYINSLCRRAYSILEKMHKYMNIGIIDARMIKIQFCERYYTNLFCRQYRPVNWDPPLFGSHRSSRFLIQVAGMSYPRRNDICERCNDEYGKYPRRVVYSTETMKGLRTTSVRFRMSSAIEFEA